MTAGPAGREQFQTGGRPGRELNGGAGRFYVDLTLNREQEALYSRVVSEKHLMAE
jgi:hypothetical protein